MAKIIPSLSSCVRKMTSGEKRFGRRLESLLEDDYLCWFDIPLGKKRRYPDYIVLHPQRGLLFLEIKDWKLSTIKEINHERVVLRTDRGEETTANPLEQARQCAYTVVNQLITDPQLRQASGKYEGKLVCPYGYGVVFANITRAQLNTAIALDAQELLLPPHLVICQDEMTNKVEAEPFQEKLWGMFNYDFPQKLTLPQIDRIRWQLFPELRLEHAQTDMFAVDDESDSGDSNRVLTNLPDIVKIMDVQQEQLARSMGAGHRVIHGVAGSGKTLILGFRCLHLAQFSRKPILVLCFNIALAARLRSFLAEKGIAEKVHVYHFHDWCGEQLKTYHVDVFENTEDHQAPIWERQVSSVITAVEKEQIPRAQYGALLIDEGHDFEADWLKLVTQMIDPEKDSLLLLYDDAQSIYRKKDSLNKRMGDFSLSSVGIQARGRTTILKLNYRNTRQILNFAYKFSKDFLQERQIKEGQTSEDKTDEDSIPVLAPELAGLEGAEPVVKVWGSLTEEAEFIGHCITTWVAKGENHGMSLKDIAVVYTSKAVGDAVTKVLSKAGLDHRYLNNAYQKKQHNQNEDKVTVLTRQSSKGLEFKTVILAGLGTLKVAEKDQADEVRLLYVGMTRAREKLLVTSSKANFYTERLLG